METVVGRKLEMGARVREFSRAHPSEEPSYATVLGKLEELLARGDAIAARQQAGLTASRGASEKREEIRRMLHFQLVRYLVAVGTTAAKSRVELAEQFRLPEGNAPHRVFLTKVKSLLEAAGPQKDLLVSVGMAPALLDELGKMVAEFEAVSEAARTGRRDHIEARADFRELARELADQVRVLDGINRYRFGQDPEVMAGWKAATHVVRSGRGRKSSQPPSGSPGDGAVPPSSGGIAPAA